MCPSVTLLKRMYPCLCILSDCVCSEDCWTNTSQSPPVVVDLLRRHRRGIFHFLESFIVFFLSEGCADPLALEPAVLGIHPRSKWLTSDFQAGSQRALIKFLFYAGWDLVRWSSPHPPGSHLCLETDFLVSVLVMAASANFMWAFMWHFGDFVEMKSLLPFSSQFHLACVCSLSDNACDSGWQLTRGSVSLTAVAESLRELREPDN